MTGSSQSATSVDRHIGQRVQLRRVMMGMTQKDLAEKCGLTFQQIQKYETADNRIPASRLFDLSTALGTPVSFFYRGLPGNVPEETKYNRSTRVHDQPVNDPLGKSETLTLINLFWRLSSDEKRKEIMQLLRNMNGMK